MGVEEPWSNGMEVKQPKNPTDRVSVEKLAVKDSSIALGLLGTEEVLIAAGGLGVGVSWGDKRR